MKIMTTPVWRKRLHSGQRLPPYYLSGLDLMCSHAGIPTTLVYPGGLDMQVLEPALVEVMKRYPSLCGRVRRDAAGLHYVDRNDAGVDLSLTRCTGALPAYGPRLHMADHFRTYYRPLYPWQVVDRDQPLLSFDLYQFDDGGAVLSVTGVHSVLDGTSFWRLMKEWADACRGQPVEGPSDETELMIRLGREHLDAPPGDCLLDAPPWGRWLTLGARFAWNHLTRLGKGVYRIPADQVAQWKHEAQTELGAAEPATAVDLAAAHCLKLLAPVFVPGREVHVGSVIDLRYKRRLRVPRGFLGTALAQTDSVYQPQELQEYSPAWLARRIRQPSAGSSNEEVLAFVAQAERWRQRRAVWRLLSRPAVAVLDAGFMLNNCSHFPIYDIDFGRGRPSWHDNVRLAYRVLKLTPTPERDGGLDLHATGTPADLQLLQARFG